jgi:hypothetical protein
MGTEIEKALASSGIPAAVEAAGELLVKLAGPAAEEFGLMLRDKVRMWRVKNALRVLGKAQGMLKDAKVEPSSVPLKTLVPILEGAAIEEDEDLSAKWAALLANAATPESAMRIHPGFPHIPSQLSAPEARVLDRLGRIREKNLRELSPRTTKMPRWAPAASFLVPCNLAESDFDPLIQNLIRLGLCEGDAGGPYLEPNSAGELVFRGGDVRLTQFGLQFIASCRCSQKSENVPTQGGA